MKKFVFYDLDGTIVDTRLDIAISANHMVETLTGKKISPEDVYRYVGKGVMYLLENCLGSSDEKTLEKGFKLYRDHYKEHMLDNTKLYVGAKEMIDRYQNCAKQAVVTNKPDPFSTDILKALNVADLFCEIVPGNSEKYPAKPDPASVLDLLKEASIDKKDALFVGDSYVDLETGTNAGIDTVLLSHGFAKRSELEILNPKYLVDDFKELTQLLDEKGW